MIKKCCLSVYSFAKRRPSLFIVMVLAVIVLLFYVTYEALHLTSSPKFCAICHEDAPSGPGGEYYTWEKNIHAYVDVTCIDCHGKPGLVGYMKAKMGGLYDAYSQILHSKENKMKILTEGATSKEYAAKLVPNEWCLFCHSDEVNKTTRENTMMSFLGIKMRNLDKVVNPQFREKNGLPDIFNGKVAGVDPNHTTHVKQLGLSCVSCHMGVAHGGELHNKTKMETCFTCHDAERPKKEAQKMPENESCSSCHQTEVKVQEGTFLKEKGIEETPWIMPSLVGECASCHTDAVTPPTPQQCIDCHEGEESYGEMLKDFQTDFKGRKDALAPIWMQLFKSTHKMSNEERVKFNEFNYFWNLIETDGSKGVHNSDLMNAIFDKAEGLAKELQGSIAKK